MQASYMGVGTRPHHGCLPCIARKLESGTGGGIEPRYSDVDSGNLNHQSKCLHLQEIHSCMQFLLRKNLENLQSIFVTHETLLMIDLPRSLVMNTDTH